MIVNMTFLECINESDHSPAQQMSTTIHLLPTARGVRVASFRVTDIESCAYWLIKRLLFPREYVLVEKVENLTDNFVAETRSCLL